MNRIDAMFKRLKKEGKSAFIAYVAAGDPDIKTSEKIVLALAKGGADVIELGIPFSDPLADGPTIQRASSRSLRAGCTVRKVLLMAARLRAKISAPLVFMTYFNIVLNYGARDFIRDAKKSGVDGMIIPDLPLEESGQLGKMAAKKDFSLILLSAPTTSVKRFRKIAAASRGFIYHVSLTGVTGAREKLARKLTADIKRLKRQTGKPVCVGFGVSKPEHARLVAKAADGVIVGSAIINILEKHLPNKGKAARAVEKFARSIAKAVHRLP